jgi:hypothetical protein
LQDRISILPPTVLAKGEKKKKRQIHLRLRARSSWSMGIQNHCRRAKEYDLLLAERLLREEITEEFKVAR